MSVVSTFCALYIDQLIFFIVLENDKFDARYPEISSFRNLVPRVSHLNAWGERGETLVGSGHVSPRIWEMTIYLMKGGAA